MRRSSSGSAAAVAAGLVPFTLGTDTAGSVRIPAACCGVIGLKPAYGSISRRGVVPVSWSFDTVGILARHVSDAALVFDVWSEPSADAFRCMDSTPAEGLRVGSTLGDNTVPVKPQVTAAVRGAFSRLTRAGQVLAPVNLSPLDRFAKLTRAIMVPESAAWHLPFLLDSKELYGPDVRARNEAGLRFKAHHCLNAQRLRVELEESMAAV